MLALADSAAGKRALCPNCSSEFRVPLVDDSPIGDVSRSPADSPIRTGSMQPGGTLIRCPACDRTLAADRSMAGQAIICPTCKRRMRVPTAEEQAVGGGGDGPDNRAASEKREVDTWVDGPGVSNPYSQAEDPYSQNPYFPSPSLGPPAGMSPFGSQSPTNYTLPAVLLLIFSSVSLLFFGLALFGLAIDAGAPAGGQPQPDAVGVSIMAMLFTIALSANVATFYGGIQMLRRRNLGWAKLGAVAALYPCGFCTVLQLPIAIWAIVILFRETAKYDFRAGSGD